MREDVFSLLSKNWHCPSFLLGISRRNLQPKLRIKRLDALIMKLYSFFYLIAVLVRTKSISVFEVPLQKKKWDERLRNIVFAMTRRCELAQSRMRSSTSLRCGAAFHSRFVCADQGVREKSAYQAIGLSSAMSCRVLYAVTASREDSSTNYPRVLFQRLRQACIRCKLPLCRMDSSEDQFVHSQ